MSAIEPSMLNIEFVSDWFIFSSAGNVSSFVEMFSPKCDSANSSACVKLYDDT